MEQIINNDTTTNKEEVVIKKKRGRKPNPDKANKNYFSEREEEYVRQYILAKTQSERNKIFREHLYYPFSKMIEAIIRRYKLFVPGETYEDTFYDTFSYLATILDKFDPSKNFKAYSYYGNICKNYVVAKRLKAAKDLVKNPSYDSEDFDIDFANDMKYSTGSDKGAKIANETMKSMAERVKKMTENPKIYNLSEKEVEVGRGLLFILTEWDYVLTTDGSNRLNKSLILNFLKSYTNLNTNDLRKEMLVYKQEFFEIKEKIIS